MVRKWTTWLFVIPICLAQSQTQVQYQSQSQYYSYQYQYQSQSQTGYPAYDSYTVDTCSNVKNSYDDICAKCMSETIQKCQYEDSIADSNPESFETLYQNNIAVANTIRMQFDTNASRTEMATSRYYQRCMECITKNVNMDYNSMKMLQGMSSVYSNLKANCEYQIMNTTCPVSYPSIDGTCSSDGNPLWGSTGSCLRRQFEPDYSDCVSAVRKSRCYNTDLPEPRDVSLTCNTQTKESRHPFLNVFFLIACQLNVHDLTDIAPILVNNSTINCCQANQTNSDLCMPIMIKDGDPCYKNKTCTNVVRSAPCRSCESVKRSPFSLVSTSLDCSTVYGSDKETSDSLRAFNGTGMLKFQMVNGSMFPAVNKAFGACRSQGCFGCGDRRANQHCGLMTFHVMCLRFHNICAKILKEKHPLWSDEQIFQIARKILMALIQCAVYKDMLPLLVGKDLMNEYNLWIVDGSCTQHDPSKNPTMSVVQNAAFRMHPMLSTFLSEKPQIRLDECFANATMLYNGSMDKIIEGMFTTPCQNYGPDLSPTVQCSVYSQNPNVVKGVDMASLNIQRGRDVGVPSYCNILQAMYNKPVYYWSDLTAISPENINRLSQVYCSPCDVDGWLGMISEYVPDGPGKPCVGPTAARLLAQMFDNMKYGYNKFFTHCNVCTPDERKALSSIRYCLAFLICKTTELKQVPANPGMRPSYQNPYVNCSSFPTIEEFLSIW